MSKNSQTERSASGSEKNLSSTIRLVAIAVMIALLVCAIPMTILGVRNVRMQAKVPYTYAGFAQKEGIIANDLSGEKQIDLVKKMHRRGQTGKFDYYCTDTLKLETASSYGLMSFANVYSNDCILVLSVFDEDGGLIYQSGGVEPGEIILRIRLFYSRDPGTYNCRAYVAGYDKTTGERIGVQYSKLSVMIGG